MDMDCGISGFRTAVGMIYTFFKRHDGKLMLRFGISAAAYTVWGLVLCRIIWVLFAG